MFDNLNLYIFGDLHDYIISTFTNLNVISGNIFT